MANLNLSQFGENTSVSDADYTFVWDSAASISKKVSRNSWLNSGTLTSSAPVTISQTWNAGSNVMTALKVVATDTASGATSNLLELWAGSTPALDFAVTKAGAMQAYGTYSSSGENYARLALACDSSGNATISTQALGTGTAGVLAFSPGNSERMRITTAGNVGIGTTAPSTKLEVALPATGNVQGQGIKLSRGAGFFTLGNATSLDTFCGDFVGKGSLTGNALSLLFTGIAGSDSDTANPVMAFTSRNNANNAAIGNSQLAFQFRNFGTNLVTVLGSGNVGIGTTSPTSKLHVASGATTLFTASFNVGANLPYITAGEAAIYGQDANTIGLINGGAGQTLNIHGTYSNSTSYERLTLRAQTGGNAIIGTNKGTGGGIARGLEFQTDGVSRWTIATNGDLLASTDATYNIGAATANRPVNINASSSIRGEYLSMTNGLAGVTRSYLTSPANGVITLTQGTGSDFNRIQFGGTGDAFPAIARDGAGIKFTGAAAGSTAWIKVPPVAVSALPLAATAGAGARAFVNDALAPTFGNAVTGGGAVLVPVYSDGSTWNVG